MKILTPEQAVNRAIIAYPSLYSASNPNDARFKVLDHLLNVIGNGIRDTDDFLHEMAIPEGFVPPVVPQKYLSGEPIYEGFTRQKEIVPGCGIFIFDSESRVEGTYSESEKADHPEVVYWLQVNRRRTSFTPYPNFRKEYSLAWRIDTAVLTPEWIRVIIWYYEEVRKFFETGDVSDYRDAPTTDPKKMAKLIRDYEVNFVRYIQDGQTVAEYYRAISEAYQYPGEELIEYRGDTEAFIRDRWIVELARINRFIDETIQMLQNLPAYEG